LLAAVKMTALIILITLMNSAGGKASDLFGELTGIAVLLTMLPYFYSCVDLIRFEGVNIRNFVSLICSVLGCVFCFIALMGASSFELAGTFIVSLIILMFYVKWHTEFGHLNRGDMLTSEQHRCSNEKKKF
ncbi:cadaverine/lysine antiporter, partial [Shigella sonnei]